MSTPFKARVRATFNNGTIEFTTYVGAEDAAAAAAKLDREGYHVLGLTAMGMDEVAELTPDSDAQRDLRFIERWANHHGTKPHMTAEQALSVIQHYPPILAITRSYTDGKVPDTPNPWAQVAHLTELLRGLDSYSWLDETGTECDQAFADIKRQCREALGVRA